MVVVLVARLVLEQKQKPWGTEWEQLSLDLYLPPEGQLKLPPE